LTSRELAFLTDIDHVAHGALAAVDQRDGSIVGVARYVGEADQPGVADVAVEVVGQLARCCDASDSRPAPVTGSRSNLSWNSTRTIVVSGTNDA
jgi:hypothetical protein